MSTTSNAPTGSLQRSSTRNDKQLDALKSRIRQATGGKTEQDLLCDSHRPASYSKHLLEELAKIAELVGAETHTAQQLLRDEVDQRLQAKKKGGAFAKYATPSDAKIVLQMLQQRGQHNHRSPYSSSNRLETPVPLPVFSSAGFSTSRAHFVTRVPHPLSSRRILRTRPLSKTGRGRRVHHFNDPRKDNDGDKEDGAAAEAVRDKERGSIAEDQEDSDIGGGEEQQLASEEDGLGGQDDTDSDVVQGGEQNHRDEDRLGNQGDTDVDASSQLGESNQTSPTGLYVPETPSPATIIRQHGFESCGNTNDSPDLAISPTISRRRVSPSPCPTAAFSLPPIAALLEYSLAREGLDARMSLSEFSSKRQRFNSSTNTTSQCTMTAASTITLQPQFAMPAAQHHRRSALSSFASIQKRSHQQFEEDADEERSLLDERDDLVRDIRIQQIHWDDNSERLKRIREIYIPQLRGEETELLQVRAEHEYHFENPVDVMLTGQRDLDALDMSDPYYEALLDLKKCKTKLHQIQQSVQKKFKEADTNADRKSSEIAKKEQRAKQLDQALTAVHEMKSLMEARLQEVQERMHVASAATVVTGSKRSVP